MRFQDPVDHFTEYYVRDLDQDFHGNRVPRTSKLRYYELAKFTGHAVPETVYQVSKTETGRYVCDCQSYFRSSKCKHTEMVQQFEKAGRQATFPQFEVLQDL